MSSEIVLRLVKRACSGSCSCVGIKIEFLA